MSHSDTTSLLSEIISGCSSGAAVADLLRKSLILATRLDVQELKEWAESELSGYKASAVLPDYRRARGDLKADIANYSYRFHDQKITPLLLEKAIGKDSCDHWMSDEVRQPIAVIEELAAADNMLARELPIELASQLSKFLKNGNHCTALSVQFSPMQFLAIVDQIKTRLLGYALRLEVLVANNPEVELQRASRELRSLVQVTIYGGNNIVAPETANFENLGTEVEIGPARLLMELRQLGVPNTALADLLTALAEDKTSESQTIGGRVKGWISEAAREIGSGTWEVAKDVTANVLSQLIAKSYGLG